MAKRVEGCANRRVGMCLSLLALSILASLAGPARADESPAQVRARIGRLDAMISGLASVVTRVEGRPGEARVLWDLARLHEQRAEAHLALQAILNPPPGELDDLITGVLPSAEFSADRKAYETLCQRLIACFGQTSPGVEAILDPPPGELDDLVMGILPGAEFSADRKAYETLCQRLIACFGQTSPGVEAILDLGITREGDGRLDEAGALFKKALEFAREPQQAARARFFRARWLIYRAARGKEADGYARALALLKPVAAGTHPLTARRPYASEPVDLRRQALWLTGQCLGHSGRPGQLQAALSGGGLDAKARVELLEGLAHSYICWRQLPFSAAAYRILLAGHADHESARHWRIQLAQVEADMSAGRAGGCHYDFSG